MALCALASGSLSGRPYVALSGARSSGVPIDVWYSHRAAWCEALAEPWPDRGVPSDPTNGWCNVAVAELSPEIRETSAPFVNWMRAGRWGEILAAAPKYPMRGGGHIYRTASGVVSWMERDINGNTGGVLACKALGSFVSTMPPHGGPHWRQRATGATCGLDEFQVLRYASPHPELGEHVMTLPPGEPLFSLAVTDTGWEYLPRTGVTPVPAPPPPAPPPPPLEPIHRSRRRKNDNAKIAAGAVGLIALLVNWFTRQKKEKK